MRSYFSLASPFNRAPFFLDEETDAYLANGFSPAIVADPTSTLGAYGTGYWRKAGSEVAESDLMTYSALGGSTVYDSDGTLKWAAHNLFGTSTAPATQGVTVTSGADYTIAFKGTGSITYSGAASGTLNGTGASDLVLVEVTAATTTLTCTVSGSITVARVYRSDLGGMQANPHDTTGDPTYVETTTSAAVYVRRNNYVYNGSTWDGPYALVEPAATNTVTYSNDYSDASWGKTGCSVAKNATGLAGSNTAWTLTTSSTSARITKSFTVSASTTYTYSRVVESGTNDWIALVTVGFTTPGNVYTWFDASTGSLGTVGTDHTAKMIPLGNGKYRCCITFTTDAADTTGDIWTIIVSGNGSTTCSSGVTQILEHDQFEVGPIATSIIVTGSAAVTRNAETRDTPAANTTGFMNATALSGAHNWHLTYADTGSATEATLVDIRNDVNNRITVTVDTSGANTGKVTLTVVSGGASTSVTTTNQMTPGVNVACNFAWFVSGTDNLIGIALEGATGATTAFTDTIPDFSSADIDYGGLHHAELDRYFGSSLGLTGIDDAVTWSRA